MGKTYSLQQFIAQVKRHLDDYEKYISDPVSKESKMTLSWDQWIKSFLAFISHGC